MPTIKDTLATWKAARVTKLTELHAPEQIIELEKDGDGYSHIVGIDKYGDLEVESTSNITPADDPFYSEIVIFHCKNMVEILKVTRIMDEEKPKLGQVTVGPRTITVPDPFRTQTSLIRLAYMP